MGVGTRSLVTATYSDSVHGAPVPVIYLLQLQDVDLYNHMFMFCFNWSSSVTITLNAINEMIQMVPLLM